MKLFNQKYLLMFFVLIIILIIGELFLLNKKESTSTLNEKILPNIEKQIDSSLWTNYTNNQLGFSIKIPLEVPTIYRCNENQGGNTPLKVFEDNQNGVIYISQDYYYDANWSQSEQKYIGECSKIIYSLESFKKEVVNPFLGWKITINNPKNDAEVDTFIKQNFGSTCTVKSKESQSDGNYKITIKGKDVGQNLMDTDCLINFQYEILYSPEKNKLMSVVLGQSCTFGTNPSTPSTYQCYDAEMIKSFKFN